MPEPSRRVIVNATPLINLSLIEQLGLLNQLYGEVLLPVIKPLVEQLRYGGIWLSDALVAEALKLADE